MDRAEVWAPRAQRLELLTPGDRVEMERSDDGWFRSDTALRPGDDYGFAIDGGDPLPDPRSHWQPQGVSGPSRVVDHDAFAWTDEDWRGIHLPWSVVYELHI